MIKNIIELKVNEEGRSRTKTLHPRRSELNQIAFAQRTGYAVALRGGCFVLMEGSQANEKSRPS
jgi:hypothetical protein